MKEEIIGKTKEISCGYYAPWEEKECNGKCEACHWAIGR